MSKRLAWLLGLVVLVSIALLVACGSKYSASSDGLVLVASQGSNQIQSFSFNLGNGHVAGISNPPATSGTPSAMVLDPAGAFAYVVIGGSQIASYKVNSDGTLTATGSTIADPNPVALAMDTAGKFLFVAEGLASTASTNSQNAGTPCVQNMDPNLAPVQYGVCAYSIGGGGSLTFVASSYISPGGLQVPNLVAVATTPMTLPGSGPNGTQNAVCSTNGNNPPTAEYVYLADAVNNAVWELVVDTSSGALLNPSNPGVFAAGSVPSGLAVDPCDRFVYVANNQSNNISAFGICTGANPPSGCFGALDGSLQPITGSPFSIGSGSGPGPVVIDPFANYLYVVFTRSNQVAPFHISTVSGTLTAGNAQATGRIPTAVAIRGDDNWLFVTNNEDGTLSQYSITPATGGLSTLPTVTTDTFPWGVAVK